MDNSAPADSDDFNNAHDSATSRMHTHACHTEVHVLRNNTPIVIDLETLDEIRSLLEKIGEIFARKGVLSSLETLQVQSRVTLYHRLSSYQPSPWVIIYPAAANESDDECDNPLRFGKL